MKKVFLLVISLLLLTSCAKVELNPEWYPRGLWKDDIFISRPNGKFNIGQCSDEQVLSVHTDDNGCDTLLCFVTDHKRKDDKVYVYADEGYCVIDETTNTAEVLVIVEKQYALSGSDDPAVTYLKSFDDFPDKAKKIFTDMEEYWSDKDYRRYGSHDRIYPDGTIVYSKSLTIIIVGAAFAISILLLATMLAILRRPVKEKQNKKK